MIQRQRGHWSVFLAVLGLCILIGGCTTFDVTNDPAIQSGWKHEGVYATTVEAFILRYGSEYCLTPAGNAAPMSEKEFRTHRREWANIVEFAPKGSRFIYARSTRHTGMEDDTVISYGKILDGSEAGITVNLLWMSKVREPVSEPAVWEPDFDKVRLLNP